MMISSRNPGLEIPQGLGTLYKMSSDGTVIDCDSWSNIFQGVCWNPGSPEIAIKPGSPSASSGTGPIAINPADTAPADTTTNCVLAGTCGVGGTITTSLLIAAAAVVAVVLISKK